MNIQIPGDSFDAETTRCNAASLYGSYLMNTSRSNTLLLSACTSSDAARVAAEPKFHHALLRIPVDLKRRATLNITPNHRSKEMPPPVAPSCPESESESESDGVSDFESESSDDSIDNDLLKIEDLSDSANGTISHVLGRLPDNPKRKAEYDQDGDFPSRSKRLLTSAHIVSSSSTPGAYTNGSMHARQSLVAPFIEQPTQFRE